MLRYLSPVEARILCVLLVLSSAGLQTYDASEADANMMQL